MTTTEVAALAEVTSDSNDYHHTFYGILNRQGQFWTPLPFHDEAAAKAHLAKCAIGTNARMLQTHKIVPVRVQLTALPIHLLASGGA